MMMSSSIDIFLMSLTVFMLSVLGTLSIRHLAHRYGWVALPRKDRWHQKPVALHGGIGFFPPFFLGMMFVTWDYFFSKGFSEIWFYSRLPELRLFLALVIGSVLMFIFGLLDDIKSLKPAVKFFFQIIGASLFIYAGGIFPLTGIYIIDVLITYFWFIGIINATNMLDNMDGLSSGVIIIAGIVILFLSTTANYAVLNIAASSLLVASLMGFWLFNKPPASVFMGDSGSLFIGFMIAGLAVPNPVNNFMGLSGGGNVVGPLLVLLIPATVLIIPIFDTTLVTITRTWTARSPFEGGRDHSSHRLVGLGFSEKKTVWILYGLATYGGLMAVLLRAYPDQTLPILVIYAIILMFTGIYLGHVKIQDISSNSSGASWTPIVSHILYKRHAAEILLDMILIILSLYAAYILRFDGLMDPPILNVIIKSVPFMVVSCLACGFILGVYSGEWKFISIYDIKAYVMTAAAGTVLGAGIIAILYRFEGTFSRGAMIIFGIIFFVMQIGSRLVFRFIDHLIIAGKIQDADPRTKVLIYGAGRAGKLILDEVLFNEELRRYTVIGFIDDDTRKIGHKLSGVPIKTAEYWLDKIERTSNNTLEVWISSRFINDGKINNILDKYSGKIPVKRLKLRID